MMQLRELNNVSSTNFYLNVLIVNLTIEKIMETDLSLSLHSNIFAIYFR
jgi:hypothetical protein